MFFCYLRPCCRNLWTWGWPFHTGFLHRPAQAKQIIFRWTTIQWELHIAARILSVQYCVNHTSVGFKNNLVGCIYRYIWHGPHGRSCFILCRGPTGPLFCACCKAIAPDFIPNSVHPGVGTCTSKFVEQTSRPHVLTCNQMLMILELIWLQLSWRHSGAEIAKKLRQNLTDPAWDPQFCGQIEIIRMPYASVLMCSPIFCSWRSRFVRPHETWFNHSAVQIRRIRDAVRRRCSSMPVTDRCEELVLFICLSQCSTDCTDRIDPVLCTFKQKASNTFLIHFSKNGFACRPSAKQVRHWSAPEHTKTMKIISGTLFNDVQWFFWPWWHWWSEVGSERKTTGSGCLRLDHDFLPDHRKTSQSTGLQTIKLSGDLMRSIFFSRFQVAQTRARCNGFLVILGRDGGAPGVRNLSRERISVRGAFYWLPCI
jgi:hypothetical protein